MYMRVHKHPFLGSLSFPGNLFMYFPRLLRNVVLFLVCIEIERDIKEIFVLNLKNVLPLVYFLRKSLRRMM